MIAQAKINAAIEDFGRDVAAQVYCDVASMQKEVEADAAAMGEAMKEIDEKIDAKIAEDAKKYDEAGEKLMAKVDDELATVEGDINAAAENRRIAKERSDSKLNATRLKVQMHQEEVKNKIAAKKIELDKAAQEELIMDLLDYADDCQYIAYSYAMEAELVSERFDGYDISVSDISFTDNSTNRASVFNGNVRIGLVAVRICAKISHVGLRPPYHADGFAVRIHLDRIIDRQLCH